MRYARVQDGEAYQSLSIGACGVWPAAQERWEIAQEIIEQARPTMGSIPQPSISTPARPRRR